MNKLSKISACLLSLLLLMTCALPAFGAENSEPEVTREIIKIYTPEDLIAFSRNCTLDTWSQDKEVHLAADIDLSGIAFTPIASFSGIFDGKNHTISGLSLTESPSPTGLFRYIQEGGCVKDLTLTGTVDPGADAAAVGTIAGENRGTIRNCFFSGSVVGTTNVGGIAGVNQGSVSNCTVEGTVTGKSMTGGIVGRNSGTITSCSNRAAINTDRVDPTVDITTIDLDFSLDLSQISDWNLQAVASDTGGIAGHSTGTIQACINRGDVGYPSIGYNLGGIVGRNSGFVQSSRNLGHIQGRKDVGGIAGQLEPDVAKILSPDYLETLSQQFEQLGGLVSAAGSSGAGMGSEIQSAIQSITAYQSSARSSLESLISSIGSGDLSGSADAIHNIGSAIGGMVNATHALTSSVGNGVENLTEDINAISSQISSISQTFALATEDAQQDLVSDVSDADIGDIREGKILNCTNQAAVEADLNVGGIVGTMALESATDPESDTVSGSGLQMRRYEVKAILQDCVNQAAVTGKRSYCGGICGRMELGTLVTCENYGTVTSTGGNYIGGIAGSTAGRIRDCFVKCSLTGQKYVGGIVGNGVTKDVTGESSTVSNCYAMVEIPEATAYIGAISGGENGTFLQNYFCSDTLAGINHVSYSTIAEPVSYADLLHASGLPRQFRQLRLRFVADDEVLKEQVFTYGDSFDSDVYPEIPEKEGHYAQWDTTDLTDLHFDTVVTAQYFPRITALSSEDVRSDGNPVLFVQGQFQEGDAPELVSGGTPFPLADDQTLLEQWTLSIPADGLESHTIRYLPQQDNVSLYLLKNGSWVPVESEAMGSYLAFPASGAQVEFAAVSTAFPWEWVVVTIVAGFGLILLLLALRRFKKLRIVCLILLVLAGIAAGILLAPRFSKTTEVLRAYDILTAYLDQPRQSMTLQVDAQIASTDLTFCADIHRQMLEGHSVTAVTEGNRTFYYSEDRMILEDGSAYLLSDFTPDYSQIPEYVTQLYELVDVASENGIYTLTTQGDQARQLLALLLPEASDLLDGVNTLTIDLLTDNTTLEEIHFTGAGNLADSVKTSFSVSAKLVMTQPVDLSLPEAVLHTLTDETIHPQQVYSEDLAQLMATWKNLRSAQTARCAISLRADCGPVNLEEDFVLYQWTLSDSPVYGIVQNGTTLYLSGDTVFSAQGSPIAGNPLTQLDYVSLPASMDEILSSGSFRQETKDDGRLYFFTLQPEGMAALAAALLPESASMEITYTEGSLCLQMDDDGLKTITLSLGGSANVLLADIDVSLSLEVTPSAAPVPELPAAVAEAIAQHNADPS